jgi:glycosyltransferase involved in cell wall biosynthesis
LKKKILIIVPGLYFGGTNRSLFNLLEKMADDESMAIDVLAMDMRGEYLSKKKDYSFLKEDFKLLGSFTFGDSVKSEGFIQATKRFTSKVLFKIFYKGDINELYQSAAKKYSNKYDSVIAFQEGHATQFASYVESENKIAWVRCDYSKYISRFCTGFTEANTYKKFNKIVCVSDYTASVFRGIYPELGGRTIAVHNIIDTEGIIADSRKELDSELDTSKFRIISVGRMDPVKRFSYIPEMAQKMVRGGCQFKWYIVGAGGEEYDKVRERIRELKMENYVILLGAKSNPYPYIASSNVLVCPSVSEACPNVVNEAKILHVPVVAADFPSAVEFVDNGKNGIITPIDEMAEHLIRIVKDGDFYQMLKNGISTFEYNNGEIKEKIKSILSGE